MRNIITILFLAVSTASALAQARIIVTTATRPVTEAPAISAYRANALTLRVKLDATRPTLTGVTTLTAEIRTSKLASNAPLAATDVTAPTGAGPFDIAFTAGQMNQSLAGAASATFWLVIYTISPSDVLDVLYTAPIKLIEHGASLTAPSPPNTAIALTRSAADALYTTLAATAALDARVTDLEAGSGTDTVLGDSNGVGVSDSSDLWVSDGTPAGAVDLTPYALTASVAAAYQPLDSDLTSLAALTSTTFGRGLITTADAAGLRTTAGLGTLATQSGTFSGSSSGTNTGDQSLAAYALTASLGTLATQSGTFSGTSSGTNTGDQDLSGYLASATAATTYVPVTRTINGSALSGDITVTAAAGTLTGSTLNATVTDSSLTSAAGGAFGTGAYAATPTRATLGLATTDSPSFVQVTASGGNIYFSDTRISRRANGTLLFDGFTGACFLQLGGTTSSFPALKRSTTTLQARLADDSDFAAVQTLYQRFGAGTPEAAVTAPIGATFHRTDGGAGTSFYVKESGTGNTGWVAK